MHHMSERVKLLQKGMYVRCPADHDSNTDPRIFVCGQIISLDSFSQTAKIRIFDPFGYLLFYQDLPRGIIEFPTSSLEHCSFFNGTYVIYNKEQCEVLTGWLADDGLYHYYLQHVETKKIDTTSEDRIMASFLNGRVDPSIQLERYEFQNPCWFLGRQVVSKSMNTLNNSIYGLKELAGCKIYLLPHQVNTIIRCLQEDPIRFMLADEVGMGKTIEAISILKLFLHSRADKRALIIVPGTLKEQWKAELLLKFNLAEGLNADGNSITICGMDEIEGLVTRSWDFVITDEVHKYLNNTKIYKQLHSISSNVANILLLSATPVQQRENEYLSLLCLLQPTRYDSYTSERFNELISKQKHIVEQTHMAIDDLNEYSEAIRDSQNDGKNPHDSEDCQDLFKEIQDKLSSICESLHDDKLTQLNSSIQFEDENLGVYDIKVVISFICSNYQAESNMIRNRRRLIETDENGQRILPVRELIELDYDLDEDRNQNECLAYREFCDWISSNSLSKFRESIDRTVKPLLQAFFSSPWAFLEQLRGSECNPELLKAAQNWAVIEEYSIDHITEILDDPDSYADSFCSRLVSIADYLYENLFDSKTVLFTSFGATFYAYKKVLEKMFSPEEVSFFGAGMDTTEVEVNAYRFQNDANCYVMLCDYTAGEGRNFQCADYIVHIDLPWDSNAIEQRIGRLDRLERDPERNIVTSIVIHTNDSFESALFQFWNEGLHIFSESLSGMEILMSEISEKVISAVQYDLKTGLMEKIPEIIEVSKKMKQEIRREQLFDAASSIYRPMYIELKDRIQDYSRRDNELFAGTMADWASLAGFHGWEDGEGIILYSADSFSAKSAINSQLIPPRWNEYLKTAQNVFMTHIQEVYDKQKHREKEQGSIRGTFIRRKAIENDYLHYFAPGDAVFECISENALKSCKGQVCAFAIPSDINWRGIILTWTVGINEKCLLDHGVSMYASTPYRTYLMNGQITTPVSFGNQDEISEKAVISAFQNVIQQGLRPKYLVHLGKRTSQAGFLTKLINGQKNIDWLKAKFPEEKWEGLVAYATKKGHKQVTEEIKKKSNLRNVKEDMERVLSARVANSAYYGLKDEDIEDLKSTQEVILAAMRHPSIILDSAAFVWLVKTNDQ